MNYLYTYPGQPEFSDQNPRPSDLVFIKMHGPDSVWLSASPWPRGTLVGRWLRDGTPVEVLPAYDEIRPVGNSDEEATQALHMQVWQGHEQPRVQVGDPAPGTLPEYPADNQPIVLRIERVYNPTPPGQGWTWKASIVFEDPNRDPGARLIQVYKEDWTLQYATGAFLKDADGKWAVQGNPGFVTDEPEVLNLRLVWGTTSEGRVSMEPIEEVIERHFWARNQDGTSPAPV